MFSFRFKLHPTHSWRKKTFHRVKGNSFLCEQCFASSCPAFECVDWEGVSPLVHWRWLAEKSCVAACASCMTCIFLYLFRWEPSGTALAVTCDATRSFSIIWHPPKWRESENLSHCQLNFLDLFCVFFDCNYKNQFFKWMGMPQTRIMSFVKCWHGEVQTAHGSGPIRSKAWLVSGWRPVPEGRFFNPSAATLLAFQRFRTCLIWL